MRRRRLLGMTVSAARRASAPVPAWVPARVRLLSPDSAGSGNSRVGALFLPFLSTALGAEVLLENRSGGGGRVGVEEVLRAPANGETLLLGNAGAVAASAAVFRSLPYDLLTALVPVSLLAENPNLLVVNPAVLPVTGLDELATALRRRPGGTAYGSGGVGSSSHLCMEAMRAQLGLDLAHLPFRSLAGFLAALRAGDVALGFLSLLNAEPVLRDGAARAIAVTSPGRWPLLPGVPSLEEEGVRDVAVMAWTGLLAPVGVPAELLGRLGHGVAAAAASVDVRDGVAALGGALVASAPAAFAARIRDDLARWRALVLRADIQPR